MANHSAPRRSPARAAWTRTAWHAATGTAASALVTLPVTLAPAFLGAPVADAAGASDPASQVLALTNAQRAQHGCGALTRSPSLDRAAQGYAGQMSATDTFSHQGTDGSSFSQREQRAGYPNPGGENIAQGQESASEVMNDWMNSPGHRRNILDCSFRSIGIGHTRSEYWVQDFGR